MTYRTTAENPSCYKASQWSRIARRVLFVSKWWWKYRWRYLEGYNAIMGTVAFGCLQFQYRWRYLEGYNTVPLSPWGYWPQMSEMENLGDFSDFRLSAPRALFGIVPSWEAESLATQVIAVFGKKSENLRPFCPAKRFSTFCSIPSWKDFVNFSQDGSIKNDFLYWGKGNSPGEFFLKGRVPFSRLRLRMAYAIMEGAKTTMWYKKGAPLCYQHRRAPLYHSSHCDYQSRCDSLIGTTLPIK